MNGLISGRSGRALVIDGDSLKSFEVDDPSIMVPRSRGDLQFLFGEARDLRVLEDTSIEFIERELKDDYNLTLALDFALISLDAELDNDIREEALEGLEELLANSGTIEKLENVLYSSPLCEDADLVGALELSETVGSRIGLRFFRRLEHHQPSIFQVDRAWDAVPTTNFISYESRELFKRVAVQEGLFRMLATIDSLASLSAFPAKAGLNQSIQRLPNYRQVIRAWVSRFRPGTLERKSLLVGAMRRRDPTVLIAEDSLDTRIMLKRAFELKGYKVIEAVDGNEALEVIHEHRPSLIVIDLNMPVGDGLETIKEIRRLEASGDHVPIVAITAHDVYEMKETALETDFNTYLNKPLDLDELDRALKDLGFIV